MIGPRDLCSYWLPRTGETWATILCFEENPRDGSNRKGSRSRATSHTSESEHEPNATRGVCVVCFDEGAVCVDTAAAGTGCAHPPQVCIGCLCRVENKKCPVCRAPLDRVFPRGATDRRRGRRARSAQIDEDERFARQLYASQFAREGEGEDGRGPSSSAVMFWSSSSSSPPPSVHEVARARRRKTTNSRVNLWTWRSRSSSAPSEEEDTRVRDSNEN